MTLAAICRPAVRADADDVETGIDVDVVFFLNLTVGAKSLV